MNTTPRLWPTQIDRTATHLARCDPALGGLVITAIRPAPGVTPCAQVQFAVVEAIEEALRMVGGVRAHRQAPEMLRTSSPTAKLAARAVVKAVAARRELSQLDRAILRETARAVLQRDGTGAEGRYRCATSLIIVQWLLRESACRRSRLDAAWGAPE